MNEINVERSREFAKRALEAFFVEERENIANGVSERNLCGRLAIHMSNLRSEYGLDEYFVDIEYNRKQNGQLKTILDDRMQVVNICCDLIVHTRGQSVQNDNLIAIEMKKVTRPNAEKMSDRSRLRALTKSSFDDVWSADGSTHPEHVCGYSLGLFVELNIEKREYLIEFYEKGDQAEFRQSSF